MINLNSDQRFILLHESNQKLLLAVTTLVEHIDELTSRILHLENKECFDEPKTGGSGAH